VLADESQPEVCVKTTRSNSDDIDGFGFFDSDTSTDTSDAPLGDISDNDTGEVEGFGLFEQSTPAVDDQGFGFFEAMPVKPEDSNNAYGFYDKNIGKPSPLGNKINANSGSTTDKIAAVNKPAERAKSSTESASIRVDTVKIDALVNLVGELVITQSMLAMIGLEVTGDVEEKLHSALAELQRNTQEIQESVMSMRMLPMSVTFNRFPRLVRDLSSKLGKRSICK
jgi:two-component system chemotaxis sensor kinase CheA